MASGDYAEVRITVAEGGGIDETWTLKDEDGTVIDITGDTLTAEVRADYDISLTMLLDLAPTVTSGTAGQMSFSIAHDDATLAALATGEYVYDLFRQPSGGVKLKIAQGPFVKTDSATD